MTEENQLAIARAIADGDLSALSAEQRQAHYEAVCHSLGLNPLTRPLEYLELNGRLTLYAKRDATDQLRRLFGVSIEILDRTERDDIYEVRARATMPDGRVDEALGAVSLQGLSGDARANALMKGETKAKRRVALSICGLGMLDETEVDSLGLGTARDGSSSRAVKLKPSDILRAWDAQGQASRHDLYAYASQRFGKRVTALTADELASTLAWISNRDTTAAAPVAGAAVHAANEPQLGDESSVPQDHDHAA